MENIFYHPDLSDGIAVEFSEEESRHIRVFRYTQGDVIHVTDGKGSLASVELVSDKKIVKGTLGRIQRFETSAFSCSIGIAPTKNQDRLEWFVEKATEIGIEKIRLFTSSNSEKPRVNLERLNRVAVAAMKQSQKVFLPEIQELIDFSELIRKSTEPQKLIAHCKSELSRTLLKNSLKTGESCIILIGPEGDFTQTEIQESSEFGFKGVSLGESRLRTETAALSALLTFDILNQDK